MFRKIKVLLAVFILIQCAYSGSICPPLKGSPFECFCSNREDGPTIVVCSGIQNTSQLEEATIPLKSLIVDRLVLLNAFPDYNASQEEEENSLEPKPRALYTPWNGILPKRWLSELRVKDLEIQNGQFNGFLLTDDAFEGQTDFLTSLVVRNVGLRGHLCTSCAPGFLTVSTKGLRRTPLLKYVDFSYNQLEVLDGTVFPTTLEKLSRVVLSGNKINRIHDKAFAGLVHLNHLDLSRNRITTISRKIFKMPDSQLTTLDLSYNAIQMIPDDMFQHMSSLKEVKLSHNLIETLPVTTWTKVPTLMDKIDLRGNFLVCNCSMTWIPRRLGKNVKLFGTCIAPKAVEFHDLKSNFHTLLTCRE